MRAYVTWLKADDVELRDNGVPVKVGHIWVVTARQPKDAAAETALGTPRHKYQYSADVCVVLATDIKSYCVKIRTYHVVFERSIRSIRTL